MSLFYDLSGGFDAEQTKVQLGLNTKRIAWSDSCNVEVYKNRGITRQNGNTRLFSLPQNEHICGIFAYLVEGYKYVLVNTKCGKFYVWDDRRKQLMLKKDGLSESERVAYIRYLDGVVVSNGIDDPFYFKPGAAEEIQQCNAISADKEEIRGTAMAVYKGRLWIADDSTLYFSALGRFDDWTTAKDAGYIRNFHCDSDKISAIMQYKEYLAIHKRFATYFLSGNNPEEFVIINFADRGAISSQVVKNIDNRQFFFSDWLFTLEQSGQLAQIAVGKDIALPIRSKFIQLGEDVLKRSVMVEYRAKNQLWLFIGNKIDANINTVWQYDLVANAWFCRKIPQPITAACCCDNKVLSATGNGDVLVEDTGNSFCDTPIGFMWRSPFFSLGEPNIRKTIDEFYLLVDESNDNSFEMAVYTDFNSDIELTSDRLEITSVGDLLFDNDTSFWADNENTGGIWAAKLESAHRASIWGSNNAVQLCLRGNSFTDNISLIGMEFKELMADD